MKRELAQRRHLPLSPIRVGSSPLNNEPVNFLDAWGLESSDASGRTLTPEEIALYEAAGGGFVDYDKIEVIDRMPTVQEVRGTAANMCVDMLYLTDQQIQDNIDLSPAMSLPNGVIYAPTDRNGYRPNDSDKQTTALLLHEVELHSQYQNLGAQYAYGKLIEEAQMDPLKPDKSDPSKMQDNPYITPNKGYLEYEAQELENRVNNL